MKKLITLIIIFFSLLLTSISYACDQTSAKNVAHLYMLAIPLYPFANFKSTVNQNTNILTANSPTVRCARRLGNRLVTAGINAYDPKAYERAMGVGPAQFAGDVAQSIQSGSVDLYMMGKELIWLSKILPPAAAGNYGPFLNTGTLWRQQIRQTIPIINMLLQIEPGTAQIMKDALTMVAPITERQIIMLAMMLD